eukprot:m.36920 g.36920  ORF g.36920 m.36920 type:complete len:57 (-) comp6707_c0_seq1:2329-2499(-)
MTLYFISNLFFSDRGFEIIGKHRYVFFQFVGVGDHFLWKNSCLSLILFVDVKKVHD